MSKLWNIYIRAKLGTKEEARKLVRDLAEKPNPLEKLLPRDGEKPTVVWDIRYTGPRYPVAKRQPIVVVTPDERSAVGFVYGLIHLAGGLPVVSVLYVRPPVDGTFEF